MKSKIKAVELTDGTVVVLDHTKLKEGIIKVVRSGK
jgi:hypothetical protein